MRHAFFRALLIFVLSTTSQVNGGAAQSFGESSEIGEEVDLELVLAVDISGSVDNFEAQTQREGYIKAITHPSVIEAIQSAFNGKIAVTYVEWADAYLQSQLVGWHVISDEASAALFAAALVEQPLARGFRTSISHAIDFSADLFANNGYAGMRRVIDISGDGPNNRGRPLALAREDAISKGITINGLPILNDRPQPWGPMGTPKDMKLDLYYSDYVIGGPGAFSVPAESFEDFRAAILSKLIREIANAPTNNTGSFADATPGDNLRSRGERSGSFTPIIQSLR